MARRRELEPGGTYHLGSRGSRRGRIQFDDHDCASWVRLLGRVAEKHEWRVLAYTVMGNHFHLVVKDPGLTLSAGMRELNGVYARRTNARYGWDAHLYRNRFWSRLLTTDAHLLAALRYVDLNPVVEGFCGHPSAWRWGSHNAIVGNTEAPPFVAVADVLALFGRDRASAVTRYRVFVEDAMSDPDMAASQTKVWNL